MGKTGNIICQISEFGTLRKGVFVIITRLIHKASFPGAVYRNKT
jgi:hypothetical protein